MAIQYNEESRVFTIQTKHSSYQFMVGKCEELVHLYYGRKITGDMKHLLTYYDRGFSGNPYDVENDRTYSLDTLPLEYASMGNGDYRTSSLIVKNSDGSLSCDLRYRSHKIVSGLHDIKGLPNIHGEENENETLHIYLEDAVSHIEVELIYSVLSDKDIIGRNEIIRNLSSDTIYLQKAHTVTLDFVTGDYDFIHFHGRHGMERRMERTHSMHGIREIGSLRGTSSHQHNPFVILAEKNTTENAGSCYGVSFMYSGGFGCELEVDQLNQTRLTMGIQSQNFDYKVGPQQTFETPQAMLSYSANGLNGLSHNFHEAIHYNVCRGPWVDKARPVLINNWEATYFDFDGDKIYDIAKQAKELGVEMLVLDDGWFGKRNDDNAGLGDWFVNENKLKGTMKDMVDRVNGLDMKFGLWIEPEMVNEDSDLYRAHPDWAFQIPGRKPVRGRNQLVLDFSRKEVVDYIYESISKVIASANIEYIKMDMNRSICDVYSAALPKERQGEVLHRYVLGVYDFLERMLTQFPNLLIEGCSGGGGRFDAGMLYYTPQIWCSDNTDAIERLFIQQGTSYGYPTCSVGAHVSAVPNHQTGRSTKIETRGLVARAGSFGYELDLNKISEEEKEIVKQQIKDFHKYWHLVHCGTYYRLANPGENTEITAWQFVEKDQREALLQVVTTNTRCNSPVNYVKMQGLAEDVLYVDEETGIQYTGNALMYAGVPIPIMSGEYQTYEMHLVAAEG